MFCIQEKVVYPGHGVAHIKRIIKKLVGGKEASFYELVFLNKDMTILVPTENAEAVGLRSLSSHEYVLGVFSTLTKPGHPPTPEFTPANWSKRNKDYQTKIKNGDLKELCMIYRDLHAISTHKELSFGEKTLFQQIESLLVEEISLVEKVGEEKTMEHLRSLCAGLPEKEFENSTY
jgi:CarD family transcriptional regulator